MRIPQIIRPQQMVNDPDAIERACSLALFSSLVEIPTGLCYYLANFIADFIIRSNDMTTNKIMKRTSACKKQPIREINLCRADART